MHMLICPYTFVHEVGWLEQSIQISKVLSDGALENDK